MGYRNFNHVLISITTVVPNVFMVYEKVNSSPGTWHTAIDLQNAFYSGSLLVMMIRCCLSIASKASDTHSLYYLRSVTTLEPYATI